MASIVHQLSSSDEDSEDSFPDLGVQVKSAKKQEPEAVDLTLSSDTEDLVEMLQEQPEKRLSPPTYKAPCLNEESVFAASCLSKGKPQDQECFPHHHGGQQAVKKPRKATSKEEREAARQQRQEEKQRREEEKQRRAAEKRQRALEREAAKTRREEERSVSRAQKPGECLKLLVVELDRRLVEAKEGGCVLSQLQEAGVTCRIVDGQVPASVTFSRVDPLSGKESQAEEAVVVVMRVEDFISAVGQQMLGWEGGEELCHLCKQWQATLSSPHLSLVVCGLEEYFRKQKNEKQRQIRSAVQGGARQRGVPPSRHITRVDIETALVTLQMEYGVNHRLFSDGGKMALYVLQVAKAVAEAPYKREKSEGLFSWYAEGSSKNCVRVDKNGVGLYKLWQQQLRQFTNVGVEVAQAVASHYPSPQALVQAYRRCGTQREAEQLLADLRVRRGVGPLAAEKRVGPELSRKLHLFLTSTDPNASLAHT